MSSHEQAAALLATKRHVMTGREIEICERIIEHAFCLGDDEDIFTWLTISFSKEIGDWIDGKAAA